MKFIFFIILIFVGKSLVAQCPTPPIASFGVEGAVLKVCKGDVVNLDAMASNAQGGLNVVEYRWDYGDGGTIDNTSGAITSYSFANSGNYRISLVVVDDNAAGGCPSSNLSVVDVLVAPDPIFSPMPITSPICLGESAVINASPSQYSQEWSLVNFSPVQDGLLEDVVGGTSSNNIIVSSYNAGQTITNNTEVPDIFANIEHEFLGDLIITISCPNGNSVILQDDDGGGTFLGVPVEEGFGAAHVDGVGWNYTWSPNANNGTMGDNGGFGVNTLPSGTYESENPMNALVGCPLNGIWTLEIEDDAASDDGTIFGWGIIFPPSLSGGSVTYFKPEIGLQADSSTWSPAPNTVISANGNTLTATPTAVGITNYTFTVTDDHGCINDTIVSVTVTPNPITTAVADATICPNAPFQLNASVAPNPGAVVYTWSPATGLSDPNIRNPIARTAVATVYTVKAYKAGHPLCFTEDNVSLTIDPIPLAGGDNSVDYCQSDVPVDINTLLDGTAAAGGVWFNGNGGTPAVMFNPGTQTTDTLIYVTGNASIGCSDTAQIAIQVALPFVLNQSNDTTICENGTAVLKVLPTGGLGGPYTETWNQGLVGNGSHSVNPLVSTCYDVFVTDVNGCTSQTETVCVNLKPPLLLSNSGNTSICMNTNATLNAVTTSGGNDGAYNYEWSEGTSVIATTSQVIVSPTQLTQYCLTLSDNCESTPVTECLEVDIFAQPEATFQANKVDGCYPIQVTFTNQTDPALVSSVFWEFGNGSTSASLGTVKTVYGAPICYDVRLTVTSPDGCIDDSLMDNYICPFDYPTAEFKMKPNPTTFFDTKIQFENLSSNDVTIYEWDFGLDALPPVSSEENPLSRFPSEEIGVYPVALVVTNADGCTDTIIHELVINSVFTLYVPNAFSPNNDGENETFYVQGESISTEDFLLRIFDRNGTVIFETTDINEHWNGTSKNGTPLRNGIYIWKVEAKDIYTKDVKESVGHVSIIR